MAAQIDRPTNTVANEFHKRVVGSLNSGDSKRVANCTRICRTWVPYDRYKLLHEVDLSSRRGWTQLSLEYCASRLSYARIHHVDWNASPCKLMPNRNVTRLIISCCTFSNISQLDSVVGAFPALSELSFSNVAFQDLSQGGPTSQGPRLTQVSLSCMRDVSEALSQWLVDIGSAQNISTLFLRLFSYSTDTDSNGAVGRLVQATNSLDSLDCPLLDLQRVSFTHPIKLKVLKLFSMHIRDGLADSVKHVLSQFSGLQTVHLTLDNISSSDSLDDILARFDAFTVVDDLFSGLQSASLRKLDFRVSIYLGLTAGPDEHPPVSSRNVVPLGQPLAEPSHCDATKISAICIPHSSRRGPEKRAEALVELSIKKALKRLSSHGTLHIDVQVDIRPEGQTQSLKAEHSTHGEPVDRADQHTAKAEVSQEGAYDDAPAKVGQVIMYTTV